jgi:hypothetical protein
MARRPMIASSFESHRFEILAGNPMEQKLEFNFTRWSAEPPATRHPHAAIVANLPSVWVWEPTRVCAETQAPPILRL